MLASRKGSAVAGGSLNFPPTMAMEIFSMMADLLYLTA